MKHWRTWLKKSAQKYRSYKIIKSDLYNSANKEIPPSSLVPNNHHFRRNREKSDGPSQKQNNKMMWRKRPRSTQDKKAESMGQSRRAGGRVRSWRDPRADLAAAADKTIAVPLVFCERAFRGQVCALHEGAPRRTHVAPEFEKRLPSLAFPPPAPTLCLLSPVSQPLVLTVSSLRTRNGFHSSVLLDRLLHMFIAAVRVTLSHGCCRRENRRKRRKAYC